MNMNMIMEEEEEEVSVSEEGVVVVDDESMKKESAIIPGLPDEIAEQCLLRIPYPYQAPVRAVSSSWNRIIKDPNFAISKKCLSLSLPYIFVMAFHKYTATIQWQALDPRSGCWFLLPPMPSSTSITPSSLACASLQRLGKIFVLGGILQKSAGTHTLTTAPQEDTTSSSIVLGTITTYHVSSNRWSVGSAPMPTPRAFFTAESVGSKIVVMGGSCSPSHDDPSMISSVECYDPTTDTWTSGSRMRQGLSKYDSAVIGNRVYLTEGWSWPFMFVPRGCIYDVDSNTWREMKVGMREGWTGFSIVLRDKLFVMSEHGDHRLKVYVPESDSWRYVGGDKFPCQSLHKPFAVTSCCCSGCDDPPGDHHNDGMLIYVMSSGLNVGVGRVMVDEEVHNSGGGRFSVEWRVVSAPPSFRHLSPCNAQILYA